MRRLALPLALLCAASGAAWAQAADPVREAARTYQAYQADIAAAASAPVASQSALDGVLEQATHDPATLARGYMASGALAAIETPAFAAGVRSRVRAAGRAAVLRQLRRDLAYARRRPPGAANAVQSVLAAMAGDNTRLGRAADRYDRLDLAAADWPRLSDGERASRGARLRALARQPRATAPRLILDSAPVLQRHFRTEHTQTIDRMLTLAGLALLAAGQPAHIASLLDDPRPRQCFELAQLQFRQCVSVSRGGEEDAACLALHGLREPGLCVAAPLRP